jgi:hypothetical protein
MYDTYCLFSSVDFYLTADAPSKAGSAPTMAPILVLIE